MEQSHTVVVKQKPNDLGGKKRHGGWWYLLGLVGGIQNGLDRPQLH